MSSLTRIVPRSQQLVAEVLMPGDLAVDLTAGKGRDTLALAQAVGATGRVVAFDVQREALDKTAHLLIKNGFKPSFWENDREIPDLPGLYLIHSCHASLGKALHHAPKAVIANLGYLPGGDKRLITRSETTRQALEQSLERLTPGGRLSVTVYPSHPGGTSEGSIVCNLFSGLPPEDWQVLQISVANRPEAPYLMIAERQYSRT
jgi:predicted methyltransferase